MITVPLWDSLEKTSDPSGALDEVAGMFTTSANALQTQAVNKGWKEDHGLQHIKVDARRAFEEI